MKKHFSKFKLLSIIMCLVIALLAGYLIRGYLGNKSRQSALRQRLKAEIQSGITENSFQRKVNSFLEDSYNEAELDAKKFNFWVERVNVTDYDGIQLSMWKVDDRCEEWYYTYFLDDYAVVPYDIKTPEQVSEFLNSAFSSGNEFKRVVLYLDPAAMYENYKKSFYKDSESILTFPQEYRECILTFAADHPEVSFSLNLPILPIKEWSKMSESKEEEILALWNDYVFYGSWYNNVKVHALGLEDWLIVNGNSFDKGQMVPDVSQKVFAIENTDSYLVDDESIASDIEAFKGVVNKDRAHGYSVDGLYDCNILFFGDSILDQNDEDTLSIPGYVGAFSGADCYNLSNCGTGACYVEGDFSFSEVSAWIKSENNGFPDGERSKREMERLLGARKSSKMFAVIEFGFNDYCRGVTAKEYKKALEEGIENLSDTYPKISILLISPLFTEFGNYGTDSLNENEENLSDFVTAAKELAEENSNVFFMDLYNDSFINKDTYGVLLRDGIHPSYDGNIVIAEAVTKKLAEIKR